jgi:hypothetical protein
MADLTEDDVRAMKKCFYDAMLESMEISPVWNLKLDEITEEPEPNPDIDRPASGKSQSSLEELLKIPMTHIQNVKDCFEACKSKEDVETVIARIPAHFGKFYPNFWDTLFSITNIYFDAQLDEEYEEDWDFDYPDDWEDDEDDDDRLEMPWDYGKHFE